MGAVHEQELVGLEALEAATVLLQRARAAHPTAGLFEAADLQWWWRTPRPTDEVPQLFWVDDLGRPVAAVVATAWRERVTLSPILLPGTSDDDRARVVERGIEHAEQRGLGPLGVEIDRTDDSLRRALTGHGFADEEDGVVETWLAAADVPSISPLLDGYRLARRTDTPDRPHHMILRSGPDVAARLAQTSLYRPDLDLVVFDDDDTPAAYGLFWYDPVTATGLVEPMRTEDDHQRRGLARHVLTTGLRLLAEAGAERIKICYRPGNPPARDLYLGVGFEPVHRTVSLLRVAGPT